MQPEDRSTRLRTLLEQAWLQPRAEREAWLSRECRSDLGLLERARALLEPDAVPDGFLSTPFDGIGGGASSAGELAPRTRLGPWRLERELGRGGMGVVWLAERDDAAFRRRVAIKVLHGASFDRDLELRFRRECALQASLEHEGIARLIDTGVAADGRPFLVLEHVQGQPLDQWCRARKPGLRERLELFAKICDAVHHAHQRLVVHRDLKPGNILVTDEGEPKLVDFGIAKLLHPEEGATWADLTRGEQRLFTPSYASPEQLLGGTVGVPSDVYALGVIGYELLVGELPFDLREADWKERLRIVCEDDPRPPSAVAVRAGSTAVTPTRLLSGDLDAILLYALRKEPERRYGSAESLGDDVRRYLTGLPVRARPDTLGYRSSRFLRRHRVASVAAAVALLSLCVGFAATLAQYFEAETARDLAEERSAALEVLTRDLEAERMAAVDRADELARLGGDLASESERASRRFDDVRRFATDLVFDVHKMLLPLPGAIAVRERVLEIGARHLESLEAETQGDPELCAELAGAWLRLGDSQGDTLVASLGRARAAASSYERALALARELAAEEGFEPARAARLVVTASTRLADALELLGDATAALALLEEAVAPARELAHGPDAEDLYVAALVFDRLAKVSTAGGRLDEASEHLDELVRLHERVEDLSGGDRELVAEGLVLVWRRSDLERARSDFEAALVRDREALSAVAALEREGSSPSIARLASVARFRVGQDLLHLGRGDEAWGFFEENVAALEEQVVLQPADALARSDLAVNWGFLALAQEAAGAFAEAADAGLRSADLAGRLAIHDPANQESSQLLVVKCLDAARMCARAARPADGADLLAAAWEEEQRRRTRGGWPDLFPARRAAAQTLASILRERRTADDGAELAEWRRLAHAAALLLADANGRDDASLRDELERLAAELASR